LDEADNAPERFLSLFDYINAMALGWPLR